MIWRAHAGLAAALLVAPVCWTGMWALGLRPQNQPDSIWWLMQAVVLLPVLEEWVFRGNLQPFLKRRFFAQRHDGHLLSPENVLTSLLFAGLHFFYHPPLWAALVFFPSLVFGWSLSRYQRVAVPTGLHAYYNAGYFLLFG